MRGDKLRSERDALRKRREKLYAFISSDEFRLLDAVDRELLTEQHSAMTQYGDVLNRRVERLAAREMYVDDELRLLRRIIAMLGDHL